ncbi:AlbA family DNA-binding domain-containing protein [Nocardia pseudovaccinii]|uniref:AlbA family DNA-binding domain-containing protein n=1 Tax=Nocardia pseudovaccinii TaxID=189540 RepID=UPI000A3F5E9A|nr:RNA-binding domain-containing protein [Nocardia pseudovaccinii]
MNPIGPLWDPRTEDALRQAAADGILEETHVLDLKRELEPGQSANKKIACDIAAFALDGGIIIIGIDEDTTPPSLWPVDLDGLAERIESIAATAVREGVRIRSTPIPASEGAGKGYLVVHVPQSPRAPHMAGGRYYGRGDKQNRVLDHAEVLRLHERQINARTDIVAEIHQAVTDLGPRKGINSILAIAAEPLGAHDQMLVPLAESPNWSTTILELVRAAESNSGVTDPSLLRGPAFARRPHAVAITTGMHDGKRWNGEGRSAELRFRENGSLFFASERGVTPAGSQGNTFTSNAIFETLIVERADLLVRLAALVAHAYEFAGTWRFGLVLTGTRDATSYTLNADPLAPHSEPYFADSYEHTAETALLDLVHDPRDTVKTLVAPLIRGLGAYRHWESYFTE